ncbi:hypothetical protein B6A14_05695 [Polynucleobacter hirudinilacicola]|uniref:Uncharacterized protein n=1 Tax=Polynucleobacter hirudinilacicola TaxID=1743166 RepID=A0A210RWB6_9BURK|nr:hypothetical protein [Polynucleobacter hirudinilacicola]OWF65298.1 hypothetical protein B6A14_05695 [Polynucleobacter hirudinilacicola]
MKKIYSLLLIAICLGAGIVNAQPIFEKSVSNLRNQRYCEILYGKRHWLSLEVKVFNTQGLNLCPEEQWKAITKESITSKYDASFALLNGPRYWVMDEIHAAGATVNNVKESFSGMEMNLRATIELGLLKQILGSKHFMPNQINRTTNFVYKAGSSIYELTSPAGEIYVMQSYSQIVNPSLMIEDLPDLEKQLKLPSGWIYQSRVLDKDLSLIANGIAHVLQDNLANSYQRR